MGALADKLIAGSNAGKQVGAILGGLSLRDASVWADCAKGINPANNFAYENAGKFPDCALYENPTDEAAMADFVRRNDTNCDRKPTEESCHKQYHYTDVAIQHGRYESSAVGARNDDVVAAITAATRMLQGQPVPAPFNFKDKREALLVLAHYVGDIHQPLHVGALHLSATGTRVNPDSGTLDPATETRGGNSILVTAPPGEKAINLHTVWDAIPASLGPSQATSAWVERARAVPRTRGDIDAWSSAWATESVKRAQQAFEGLTFTKVPNAGWEVTLPTDYAAKANEIKKTQLTAASAHLAQLLQAVWP